MHAQCKISFPDRRSSAAWSKFDYMTVVTAGASKPRETKCHLVYCSNIAIETCNVINRKRRMLMLALLNYVPTPAKTSVIGRDS